MISLNHRITAILGPYRFSCFQRTVNSDELEPFESQILPLASEFFRARTRFPSLESASLTILSDSLEERPGTSLVVPHGTELISRSKEQDMNVRFSRGGRRSRTWVAYPKSNSRYRENYIRAAKNILGRVSAGSMVNRQQIIRDPFRLVVEGRERPWSQINHHDASVRGDDQSTRCPLLSINSPCSLVRKPRPVVVNQSDCRYRAGGDARQH
jgi:hypothetical protein